MYATRLRFAGLVLSAGLLCLPISCRRGDSGAESGARKDPGPSSARARDDSDDEDDEDEDEAAPSGPGRKGGQGSRTRRSMGRARRGAETINGDPNGPDPKVFDAIIAKAIPRVQGCFVDHLAELPQGNLGIQVRIQVVGSGQVARAEVLSGVRNKAVRACVLSVFRSLSFPKFSGPAVFKVIPYTLIRAAPGKGERPRPGAGR